MWLKYFVSVIFSFEECVKMVVVDERVHLVERAPTLVGLLQNIS